MTQFQKITASASETVYSVGAGMLSLPPLVVEYGKNCIQGIFKRYVVESGSRLLYKKDLRSLFGSGVDAPILERFLAEQPTSRLQLDTSRMMGGPSTWWGWLFHDRALMDQELQLLFADVATLSPEAYLERLFKSIVPRELPKGLIVPAPHPYSPGALDFYEVYDVIADGGLVAYAFRPFFARSQLQPMLIFRSSPFHFSARDLLPTWMNNFQKTIGSLGYEAAKDKLSKLLADGIFCPVGEQILVGGFSIGGLHAQLFTADHGERVSKAIFFNDPSMSDAAAVDRFADQINVLGRLPFDVEVDMFRTVGDIANFSGRKHLYCGVDHPQFRIRLSEIQPNSDQNLTTKRLHGWKIFDTPEKNYTEVIYEDPDDLLGKLDNSKRGPDVQCYRGLRGFFGAYLIFPILFFWSSLLNAFEYATGIALLRRTNTAMNLAQ